MTAFPISVFRFGHLFCRVDRRQLSHYRCDARREITSRAARSSSLPPNRSACRTCAAQNARLEKTETDSSTSCDKSRKAERPHGFERAQSLGATLLFRFRCSLLIDRRQTAMQTNNDGRALRIEIGSIDYSYSYRRGGGDSTCFGCAVRSELKFDDDDESTMPTIHTCFRLRSSLGVLSDEIFKVNRARANKNHAANEDISK
jgi:hypothetical protein